MAHICFRNLIIRVLYIDLKVYNSLNLYLSILSLPPIGNSRDTHKLFSLVLQSLGPGLFGIDVHTAGTPKS